MYNLAYRPPNFEKSFFEQISSSLSLIVNQYENMIVTGNLNINLLDPISGTKNYLSDLRDSFALTNLVKDNTCFQNKNDTLLYVILTNIPNCFQNTVIGKNSFSDLHFIKLPPKTIRYRSYKNFNIQSFLHKLDQKLIKEDIYKECDSYSKLTEIFSEVLQKHAPAKSMLLEETVHLL